MLDDVTTRLLGLLTNLPTYLLTYLLTYSKVLDDVTTRLLGRVPLGGSQLDRASLRSRLRRVVEEYISSHDVREVERRLHEIHVPADLTHELARAAIELGLERRDHERELVSQLLSALHGSAHLRAEAVVRGFEQLLSRVDDLAIDNPQASAHLASFMTRAVADEILPAAFVATPPPGSLATALQIQTLNQARAPLIAAHLLTYSLTYLLTYLLTYQARAPLIAAH